MSGAELALAIAGLASTAALPILTALYARLRRRRYPARDDRAPVWRRFREAWTSLARTLEDVQRGVPALDRDPAARDRVLRQVEKATKVFDAVERRLRGCAAGERGVREREVGEEVLRGLGRRGGECACWPCGTCADLAGGEYAAVGGWPGGFYQCSGDTGCAGSADCGLGGCGFRGNGGYTGSAPWEVSAGWDQWRWLAEQNAAWSQNRRRGINGAPRNPHRRGELRDVGERRGGARKAGRRPQVGLLEYAACVY